MSPTAVDSTTRPRAGDFGREFVERSRTGDYLSLTLRIGWQKHTGTEQRFDSQNKLTDVVGVSSLCGRSTVETAYTFARRLRSGLSVILIRNPTDLTTVTDYSEQTTTVNNHVKRFLPGQ